MTGAHSGPHRRASRKFPGAIGAVALVGLALLAGCLEQPPPERPGPEPEPEPDPPQEQDPPPNTGREERVAPASYPGCRLEAFFRVDPEAIDVGDEAFMDLVLWNVGEVAVNVTSPRAVLVLEDSDGGRWVAAKQPADANASVTVAPGDYVDLSMGSREAGFTFARADRYTVGYEVEAAIEGDAAGTCESYLVGTSELLVLDDRSAVGRA